MHTQSPLGFKSVAFFLSLKAHSANNCLSYLVIISCREDFKKHNNFHANSHGKIRKKGPSKVNRPSHCQ